VDANLIRVEMEVLMDKTNVMELILEEKHARPKALMEEQLPVLITAHSIQANALNAEMGN